MTTEAHQMGELQTRNALPADLEWLLDLRLATMDEHFERSGHKLSLAEQRDRLIQSYSAIQIIQKARHANVPVSLHVLKVNPAKGLYERLGFNVTSDLGHSYEMQTDA